MTFDLDAGKYAPYVWPAYAFSVLILGGLVADTLHRARRWRRAAEAQDRTTPPEPTA